jgi:hypothetical protein
MSRAMNLEALLLTCFTNLTLLLIAPVPVPNVLQPYLCVCAG